MSRDPQAGGQVGLFGWREWLRQWRKRKRNRKH